MKKILLFISIFLAISCTNEKLENHKQHQEWNKFVGNLDEYRCPRMFTLESIDTTICSGYKSGKPWFSLYRTSDASKLLEWEDVEVFDSTLVYKIYKGYGEYEDFDFGCVAPCFYKFNNGSSVVELTFCRKIWWDNDINNIGPWGCNGADFNLGLGLSMDLIGGGGYYSTVQQVIFINKNKERKTLEFTTNENGSWPAHIKNGYKESIFIGRECLTCEGEMLYTLNYDFNGIRENEFTFFSSYDEYIDVNDLYIRKYNIKEQNITWETIVTPPFDIPEGAHPKISLKRAGISDNTVSYTVNMVFYDGTLHQFKFELNKSNGSYILL